MSDEFVVAFNCHCSNCRDNDRLGVLAVGRDRAGKAQCDKGCQLTESNWRPRWPSRDALRAGFSLLYWTGDQGKIRVPYGSLIDGPALKPTAHMFVGSKAPWYEILDDLPQHDEYPWS